MSEKNPINGIMDTAMDKLKTMVDVSTIVGDPIKTDEGTVLIPISKVSFGLATGGGEYSGKYPEKQSPVAGGVGAGVTMTPVAFIVASKDTVRLLPMEGDSAMSKLIDYIPIAVNKVYDYFNNKDSIVDED